MAVDLKKIAELMKKGWSWEGSGGNGGTSGSSGSSIQPDWNQSDSSAADYVKNRTHYVEIITLLEWDGNKDGLETADVDAGPLALPMIRVSDTPPQEVYKGMECTIVFHGNGADQSSTVHVESLVVGDNTEFFSVSESAFFVPENAVAGSPFPASGVWVVDAALVMGDESAYVKSCKAEVVHTIDPKYLPAGGSGGGADFVLSQDSNGTWSASGLTQAQVVEKLLAGPVNGVIWHINNGIVNQCEIIGYTVGGGYVTMYYQPQPSNLNPMREITWSPDGTFSERDLS